VAPRVAVVRVPGRADVALRMLREAGAEPILVPAMRIAPPEDPTALIQAASDLSRYDGVIFGSVAAAEALAGHLPEGAGSGFDGPVFCVGAETRRRIDGDPVLSRAFIGPRIVPARARAESLEEAVRATLSPLAGKRLLFPRPPEGRTVLIERLEASRAEVHAPDAYCVVAAEPLDDRIRADVDGAEAFLFFSGEAIRCFLEVGPEPWARRRLDAAWVGVIGPAGAERARTLGVRVDAFPESPGLEALVAEWRRAFESDRER